MRHQRAGEIQMRERSVPIEAWKRTGTQPRRGVTQRGLCRAGGGGRIEAAALHAWQRGGADKALRVLSEGDMAEPENLAAIFSLLDPVDHRIREYRSELFNLIH